MRSRTRTRAWAVAICGLLAGLPALALQEDVRVAAGGVSDADVVLTKSGVINGNQIVYTIEITNNGPSPTTQLVVTDVIPTEVSFVGDDCGGGNVPPWTWNIAPLADGATATCDITVAIDPGFSGFISNTAVVVGDNLVNTADDTDTIRLEILAATIPTLGGAGLLAMVLLLLAFGVTRLRGVS